MNRTAALKSTGPITERHASFIATRDGTRLYWKEWGSGAPLLFVHSAAAHGRLWDYQVTACADRGFRCITFDRRGHGRSDQPGRGYDYDTWADDIADVIDALGLHGLTLIGHSMGCGEILRYLTRHGDSRVSGVVLLATTTPFLLKTDDNPQGVPAEAFESLRGQWRQDYAKWIADNTAPFFNAETSPAMMQWGASLLGEMSVPIAIACNKAATEADFRPELPKIKARTLVIHGDRDVSAPLALTGLPTAALIPGCELRVYEDAPHGLMFTHMDRLHADLLAFVSGSRA
jgi:non-heme chloroperoxidase